jgi:hypothetical protein
MNLISQEVWFSFPHSMYDFSCQKICLKIKEKTTYKIFSLFSLKSAFIHHQHSLLYSTHCITSIVHKTIKGTIKTVSLITFYTNSQDQVHLFIVIPKQKQNNILGNTRVEENNLFFSHHSLKTVLNYPK